VSGLDYNDSRAISPDCSRSSDPNKGVETLTEIYVLDLIGTFAFAVYGAYVALKKEFDIFGVLVSALLTALGGGTLRELILGNTPFYFYDNKYILVILTGCVFSIAVYKGFYKISKYVLVIDAVGLSTFAFIGAEKAAGASLGSFAIIFLATTTAVGGGLLRDISIREVPQIFHRDFYASPAIFLGILYAISRKYMHNPILIYCLISLTFALRIYAIYFNVSLWRPWRKKPEQLHFPFSNSISKK